MSMSEATAAIQTSTLGLHPLEEYEPSVGAAAIERILKKADPLRTLHLVHISSTFYGGGVTEILTPLTLTLNAMGIETGPEYAQQNGVAQRIITPAIDPFSAKNREMSEEEIEDCLEHYRVPTDRPLVVQVSRFDRWKDPVGAIEAFRKAAEQVDARLVLVGNNAVDDPESGVILESIHSSLDERIIVLTVDDPTLVNALQRRAARSPRRCGRAPP
jgi:glycosyltransferase involved in cell wall biosynthesis